MAFKNLETFLKFVGAMLFLSIIIPIAYNILSVNGLDCRLCLTLSNRLYVYAAGGILLFLFSRKISDFLLDSKVVKPKFHFERNVALDYLRMTAVIIMVTHHLQLTLGLTSSNYGRLLNLILSFAPVFFFTMVGITQHIFINKSRVFKSLYLIYFFFAAALINYLQILDFEFLMFICATIVLIQLLVYFKLSKLKLFFLVCAIFVLNIFFPIAPLLVHTLRTSPAQFFIIPWIIFPLVGFILGMTPKRKYVLILGAIALVSLLVILFLALNQDYLPLSKLDLSTGFILLGLSLVFAAYSFFELFKIRLFYPVAEFFSAHLFEIAVLHFVCIYVVGRVAAQFSLTSSYLGVFGIFVLNIIFIASMIHLGMILFKYSQQRFANFFKYYSLKFNLCILLVFAILAPLIHMYYLLATPLMAYYCVLIMKYNINNEISQLNTILSNFRKS